MLSCKNGHLNPEPRSSGHKCKQCYNEKHALSVKSNPHRNRVKSSNYRARQRGAEGTFTVQDILNLRDRQNDKCVYCEIALNNNGHIDHVTPLVRGGSNWPSNLQLLCPLCNCTKNDKTHEEYLEYQRNKI